MEIYIRKKQKKAFYQKPSFIFIIIAIVFFGIWVSTNKTTPSETLATGISLYNEGKLDEAEAFLDIVAKSDKLSNWANLYLGRIYEKKGTLDRAIQYYSAVDINSAANLDARVALLHIYHSAADINEKPAYIPPELTTSIKLANRPDLMSAVLLLQGKEAEKNKNAQQALAIYQKIRNDYPNSPSAKIAKERVYILQKNEEPSIAWLTDEIKLLMSEKQYNEAFQTVLQAIDQTKDGTSTYYEMLLLEEQIFRKLKKHTEADNLLTDISAHGQQGTADIAILRMAKNSWNINDLYQALEYLDVLKERFPKSPELPEARYIEGRILTEQGNLDDAKTVYTLISKDKNETPQNIARALKRLAWLAILSDDYVNAAQYFAKLREVTNSIISKIQNDEEAKTFSANAIYTAVLEREHTLYWEGWCLTKIEGVEAQRSQNLIKATQLWHEIMAKPTYTYYYFLAAKALNKEVLPLPSEEVSNACSIPIREEFIATLKLFNSPILKGLSQNEIDWFFARSFKSEPTDKLLDEEQFKSKATKAKLSVDYGQVNTGIILATSLKMALLFSSPVLADAEACQGLVMRSVYPVVEPELFAEASKKNGVPLATLLSVARVESYFNAEAVSSAGAIGLMQLMPQTAKAEGWNEKDSLYSPSLNILLGGKLLAKLLGIYDKELAYAAAAYNAGGSPVNRWKARYPEVIPEIWTELISYPETNLYVKNIIAGAEVYKLLVN